MSWAVVNGPGVSAGCGGAGAGSVRLGTFERGSASTRRTLSSSGSKHRKLPSLWMRGVGS